VRRCYAQPLPWLLLLEVGPTVVLGALLLGAPGVVLVPEELHAPANNAKAAKAAKTTALVRVMTMCLL
jgi:hypothetical protein